MTEIIRLNPHDPLPGPGRYVLVLRRLAEDDPTGIALEIAALNGTTVLERLLPQAVDGKPLHFDQAIEAGKAAARRHGLNRIIVLDRTAGPREREILAHGGDHGWHSERLQDTDPEDGEQGTDLRDRTHDAGYLR